MDNAEIPQWVDSVAQPFLKQWYHEYLSHPDNASFLLMGRVCPSGFGREILSETLHQHDSATAVSLARELQDLSINAGSLQLSNSSTAVSGSNDGEFEEMQAMISTVKLTDSRTPMRLPGDVRRQ